jgi:hypothetical protein
LYLSDNAGLAGGLLLRRAALLVPAAAALLALAVSARTRSLSLQEIAWPDECIYLVGARNVVERGTLDTNFYVTYSVLRRGHPHRDVHMPGYVFALAPVVALLGPTLDAAALLNVVMFAGCAVLVAVIARRVLGEENLPAVAAAAFLFPVLPPFPGYLFVVYGELVFAFVFLAGIAWVLSVRGTAGAIGAGLLYGVGALFRESLLFALPLYFFLLDRRTFWRRFLPTAALTVLAVMGAFSRHRAIHPNNLFPSILEEARASEHPGRMLAGAVWKNFTTNLQLAASVEPAQRAEDAVLVFLLLLTLAAVLGYRRLGEPARGFARGTFTSLGLLTVAVFVVYVVRERGGVWGGVRAFMAWMPLILILAAGALVRRRPAVVAAASAAAAVLFLVLGAYQIRFFNRYKGIDLEDQRRLEAYLVQWLDPYRPHRIVSRAFLYGLSHYPVEVVWSPPRSGRELAELNAAIPYDFLVIHEKSDLRHVLMDNPRWLRLNKADRGAENLIWRRMW